MGDRRTSLILYSPVEPKFKTDTLELVHHIGEIINEYLSFITITSGVSQQHSQFTLLSTSLIGPCTTRYHE